MRLAQSCCRGVHLYGFDVGGRLARPMDPPHRLRPVVTGGGERFALSALWLYFTVVVSSTRYGRPRVQAGNTPPVPALDELARAYGNVQLATLVSTPPRGWTYELKYDGYRILALKAGDEVRLLSRSGRDWTATFAVIARDVARLKCHRCVIDGEVCALDERGYPSFQLLQNRDSGVTLAYFVFDLLLQSAQDLRPRALEDRRARLATLVAPLLGTSGVFLSSAVEADPATVLRLACASGLEGIVAKELGSPYSPGRSTSWQKIKCTKRQEFAIVGWIASTGTMRAVGSILLGLRSGDRYVYAGKVGTGLTDDARTKLWTALVRDENELPTAADVPRFGGRVHFVTPRYVAEVAFTEWTAGNHIRHPSFKGLRDDKAPEECVREVPGSTTSTPPSVPAPRAAAASSPTRVEVAGVSLSHPSRELDPAGISKLELARYYAAVGPHMVPHVRGRPLSLLRWAGGKETAKGGTFLRHARAWGPDALRRVTIQEKTKVGEYLIADSTEALVSLAQMDILEIHTWNSTFDHLEHPDRVVFDLDPAPDVAWPAVVRAAKDLRDRLQDLRLKSWVKTTGGKGLHVVVPLAPRADWSTSFAFTRRFVDELAREEPERFVATMAKAERRGRIFLDYLRNSRTSTSVAAYSIRARPGPTVSVPLAWRELDDVDPGALTASVVLRRLGGRWKDPWLPYWNTRQTLPAAPRRRGDP